MDERIYRKRIQQYAFARDIYTKNKISQKHCKQKDKEILIRQMPKMILI